MRALLMRHKVSYPRESGMHFPLDQYRYAARLLQSSSLASILHRLFQNL